MNSIIMLQTRTDESRRRLSQLIFRLHIQTLLLISTVAVFATLAWCRLVVWPSELLAVLIVAFFAIVTSPFHLRVERLPRHGRIWRERCQPIFRDRQRIPEASEVEKSRR